MIGSWLKVIIFLGNKTTKSVRNCHMIFMTSLNQSKFAKAVASLSFFCTLGITALAEDKPAGDVKTDTKAVSDAKTNTSPIKPVPSDEELKKTLTPLQYKVTRENGTERPFTELYEEWKKQGEGIYVDIITGKPLFSSKDKFDSHCGWPSFSKPISDDEIQNLPDYTHGMIRTEVRAANSDSHLGHVFDDGPKEMGGLRYCINAAAIRFIPKEKLKEAGYGELVALFEAKKAEEKEDK